MSADRPGFFALPSWRRIVLLLVLGLGLVAWTFRNSAHRWRLNPRITDEIGMLGDDLRARHEMQLEHVFQESGVDIRFLLVPNTGEESTERYAVRRARELGVGRETDRQGLLLLYDRNTGRMRVEVGPTLQGIVTDAFVGFLVREHARDLFEGGDPELALRLAVRMLHWRIREAQLGEQFDPSIEKYIDDVRRLATGGGASGEVGRAGDRRTMVSHAATAADSARFRPRATVEEAQAAFLEWLALDRYVANLPLFTAGSQRYLATLPLTRGYRSGWLAMEFGRRFEVDVRDSLAMLYHTGSPFASPRFFRRSADGWQVETTAEVTNTMEAVGGWYTWMLLDSGDEFSRVFADRYLKYDDASFGTYYRVAGGDNRRLATRWSGAPAQPAESGVEHLTVFQAASRVEEVRERPSVVVLYHAAVPEETTQWKGLRALAELSAGGGIELLAFSVDSEDQFVAALPAILETKEVRIPARHIYPWRAGLLDSSFGRLGIAIGKQFTTPLVAVRDRTGRVVMQAQGVTSWSAILEAARATVP